MLNQTKSAQQLAAEKENIISLLLHDLRPPLQVLRFLTNHLSGGGNVTDPAQTAAYLQELNMAVEELTQSSSAIFTWLEVQRDRFPQPPQQVAAAAFLHQVVKQFGQEVPLNTSEIKVDTAPGLETVTDTHAVAVMLHQLLRNAAAQKKGGPVMIGAAREGNHTLWWVKDEGRGISGKVSANVLAHLEGETTLPVLFRYGYRIIIQVLQLLNGTIRFTATPGGTTVTLVVPDAP